MITIHFTKEQAKILQTAAKIDARALDEFSALNAVRIAFDDFGLTVQSTDLATYYSHHLSWYDLNFEGEHRDEILIAKSDLKNVKGPTTLKIESMAYTIDEVTEKPFFASVYPKHPERSTKNMTDIGSNYFDAIQSVALAAETKASLRTPALQGIHHSGNSIVATDSSRTHTSQTAEWPKPFLIPASTAKTLATIFRKQPAAVSVDDQFVHYHTLRFREIIDVAVRRLEMNYPDTSKLFDQKYHLVAEVLDTNSVIKALDKIIRLLKGVQNVPARIDTGYGAFKLWAIAQSRRFETTIDATVKSDRRFAVNAKFLKDALQHVGPCEVWIGETERDPIVLEGTGRKALILPVVIR